MKVELVGGKNNKEGRVEIIRNGMRGTICDDNWDDNDAKVICRMLGFKSVLYFLFLKNWSKYC